MRRRRPLLRLRRLSLRLLCQLQEKEDAGEEASALVRRDEAAEVEMEAERKAKDAEMEDMRRKLESALDAERRERQGEAEGLRGKIKEYEELMRSSEGENRELLRARDDEKRGLEEQLASAVRGRAIGLGPPL